MTALIVHVFYPELWPELADCIRNFPAADTDVFITCPVDNPAVGARCKRDFPRADVRLVENRGYDIGPFFDVLNSLDLSNYEFVAKIHTKRNVDEFVNYWHLRGDAWRRCLLSFCSTPAALARTQKRFRRDSRLGMFGPNRLILDMWTDPAFSALNESGERELRRMGLDAAIGFSWRFVAGSMFMVRAELLKPLQRVHVLRDFDRTARGRGTPLAHLYERLLGCVVEAQDYKVKDGQWRHLPSAVLSAVYQFYCLMKYGWEIVRPFGGKKKRG